MKITWSDEAFKDFEENLEYLLENWPTAVLQDFTDDLEETIIVIKNNPQAFKRSNVDKNIRIAVISNRITLFYEIKNQEIHLLRFWNNYKDLDKNEFT